MKYAINHASGDMVVDLGRIDWADWDSTGDLLVAKEGTSTGPRLVSRKLATP